MDSRIKDFIEELRNKDRGRDKYYRSRSRSRSRGSSSSERRHRNKRRSRRSRSRSSSSSSDSWKASKSTKHSNEMYQQHPTQNYQQSGYPQVNVYGNPANNAYQTNPQYYQTGYADSLQNYAYSQPASYGQTYSNPIPQPQPPGEEYATSAWTPVPPAIVYPASTSQHHNTNNDKSDEMKKEAIAQELKQQKATLAKQREEHIRKAAILRRELDKLRLQKHELLSEKSPPRDSQRVLRENANLQMEIQNKLKEINRIIDLLSGIIGDGYKSRGDSSDGRLSMSPARKKEHKERTKSPEKQELKEHFNYIHYDPELHWCRVCDVFPKTAKDYLNHLQSAEHRKVTSERQLVDAPWHKIPLEAEPPTIEGAPTKRIPIKGLQFFISAPAWFCKLCDAWIGDLHCASLHLKSKMHSQNYANFAEQNPHWETDWIIDREKAYDRCIKSKADTTSLTDPTPASDKKTKKKKEKRDSPAKGKEKKKKKKQKKHKRASSKSSTSSSSSNSSAEITSDRSKSIRVAMRNKMKAHLMASEEMSGKLEVLNRLVESEINRKKEMMKQAEDSVNEDNVINQWMTVSGPSDEKRVFDNIKGKIKQRQDVDKEKASEALAEQKRKERERELRELHERQRQEEKEREREQKEKDLQRIKELRERNRRKHRSESSSPGRGRSKSTERKHYDKSDEESFKPRNKQKSNSGSNKKLPFIGRMPLFKNKKVEEREEVKKPEEYDVELRESRFQRGSSVRGLIPAPGVVHNIKLATPIRPPLQQQPKLSAENPPPPPQIVPEPPQITMQAPPPPSMQMHDMIIEEEHINIPPPPPIIDMKDVRPTGNLPRDFQDALNIIFPGDQPPEGMASLGQNVMYNYNVEYPMMYEGYNTATATAPPAPDISEPSLAPGMNPPPPPELTEQVAPPAPNIQGPPPPPAFEEPNELAMLGIDAGDMAAQTF